jgi:cyclophilin family peptidyl-prolyl cis-trans isomerase
MFPAPSSSAAPGVGDADECAWLEWSIGGTVAGRMVFELYDAAAPRTCASFRALCTGSAGVSSASRLRLHYKGCAAHRLIPGFMLQAGDISSRNDGTGGESIYGANFADEAGGLALRHSARGVLAMANVSARVCGAGRSAVGGGRRRRGCMLSASSTSAALARARSR